MFGWLLGVIGLVLKTERPVLDRPLKVGRKHSAFRVTVLTPATTYPIATHFTDMKNSVNATSLTALIRTDIREAARGFLYGR
jgi:hypothetical protein